MIKRSWRHNDGKTNIKGLDNTVINESQLNKQTEYDQENKFTKQAYFISTKEFTNNYITNSPCYPIYQVTKEDIDILSASDNWQEEEEYTLEESICRPLLELQKPQTTFKIYLLIFSIFR